MCLRERGGSVRGLSPAAAGSSRILRSQVCEGTGRTECRVFLPEAVSIVVAVDGKFLSLPTIILTTRPLLALLRPPGAKGSVWAGMSA